MLDLVNLIPIGHVVSSRAEPVDDGWDGETPLGPDIYSLLWGASHPFSSAKLDSLYNDEDAYIEAFSAAAAQSVSAGVLLARDIPDQIEEARREYRRVRSM